MPARRLPLSTDKRRWHPSLLPGPIALVSTVDATGAPNVAPKSFLQMVSLDPPILMFSGTPGNPTEENIAATGCFGLGLVDGRLAERAFGCIRWHGAERIANAGFTLTPATAIAAPMVDEAPAWIECRLVDTKALGGALVIFGEILAASILETIANAEPRERYPALGQALYLEDGIYATVDRARRATPESAELHGIRWAYLLTPVHLERMNRDLVEAHVAHLRGLDDAGRLELCGPFSGGHGGIVILRGVNEAEVQEIAETDPFVVSGAESFEIRRLESASRDNDYLLAGR